MLDIGCGVGGTARFLAKHKGCTVTGLDISEDFIEAATFLTKISGLTQKVKFQQGDAMEMPFKDNSFPTVMSMHVTMNLPEKALFFSEVSRVMKKDGQYLFYELVGGEIERIHLPVPWAEASDCNYLISEAHFRSELTASGLAITNWVDVTQPSLEWYRAVNERIRNGPPNPLGVHILLGHEFAKMTNLMMQNLAERRIKVIMGTAKIQVKKSPSLKNRCFRSFEAIFPLAFHKASLTYFGRYHHCDT